jgi:hypothetical protein
MKGAVMKSKKLVIILIASLAINLAFVSTFIYQKFIKSTVRDRHRPRLFEERFKLTDKQKKEIKQILDEFKVSLVNTKHDMLEKRMSIVEMLGDPDTEIEKIWSGVDEINKLEGELNIFFVKVLLEIGNILDSTQRIDFLLRLSKRWFFYRRSLRGK